MNCYEWRKKITGNVTVNISINVIEDSYTLTGSAAITHDELYSEWTHRELQCLGEPKTTQENWILRGNNLCIGRSQITGFLTQRDKIKITITSKEDPPADPITFDSSIYFAFADPSIPATQSLLPLSPYPDWEDDPYSVAFRKQINDLSYDFLRVGISDVFPGDPNYEVPLKWLKDGLNAQSQNGYVSASLTVSFTLS